ncbi:MAG: amino acid ABC transporter ATP-binding/permease protein [Treponema sp.]
MNKKMKAEHINAKKRSGFSVAAGLIVLVRPLIFFMTCAVLFGTLGHLCALAIPALGGYALLAVKTQGFPLALKTIFIAAAVAAVLRGILRYIEQTLNHYIAFKLLAVVRDKVFKVLRTLCPAKLEGRDKGDLISLITSDIELLEVFYAHTISPVAISALFTLAVCAFLLRFHYAFALIALLSHIAVGIVIPLVTSKYSGRTGEDFRGGAGDLSSHVLESLRGLFEILQYGTGNKRLKEMNEKSARLLDIQQKMKVLEGQNGAASSAVILLFDAAALFTGALLFKNGAADFEGVLIPFIVVMSSFGPAAALANLGSTLQNTFASGSRILDILAETPETVDVAGKAQTQFTGAEAKNVHFDYGAEQVLSGVNIAFAQNKIIGIAGKSGSGKSTLLKLLMRFWSVKSGAVHISSKNIEDVNTADLRAMESYVTQETHLFRDSIENNVKIAKLDATHEEVVEACKKACVHDFIMSLPKGYDTPAGELGSALSSGERQRLGLARAFLHGGDFMLFDEPTSNLDSLNEAGILKSIKEEKGSCTVVLVSHRESSMRIADETYGIENGRRS